MAAFTQVEAMPMFKVHRATAQAAKGVGKQTVSAVTGGNGGATGGNGGGNGGNGGTRKGKNTGPFFQNTNLSNGKLSTLTADQKAAWKQLQPQPGKQ